MDTILAVLMFAVLLGSLWDIRRGQRITEAIVRMCMPLLSALSNRRRGLPR